MICYFVLNQKLSTKEKAERLRQKLAAQGSDSENSSGVYHNYVYFDWYKKKGFFFIKKPYPEKIKINWFNCTSLLLRNN